MLSLTAKRFHSIILHTTFGFAHTAADTQQSGPASAYAGKVVAALSFLRKLTEERLKRFRMDSVFGRGELAEEALHGVLLGVI